MSSSKFEALNQKFCNDVANLLKPIIKLRIDELKPLKATLSSAEQEKLDAAVDIHRTIVAFTNNNRYFQNDKIDGNYNCDQLAKLLHVKIDQHKTCLEAKTTQVGKKTSLAVPIAQGAGDELPKMALSLLKINKTYHESSEPSVTNAADKKVSDVKSILQDLKNADVDKENQSKNIPGT